MGVPLLTLDETLAKIDAGAAGVGGDEAVFRDAVGAVSPALAAA
jgi:hypothetical protein